LTFSGQSDTTALFSTVRYTLCDTYIDFSQPANSRKSISSNLAVKSLLMGTGDSGLLYSRNGKMLESVFYLQSHSLFFKLLILCSSCDSFPLKLKKKNG
jgi:hypothetical protein